MKYLLLVSTSFLLTACYLLPTQKPSPWLVIDTFNTKTLTGWQLADTQNETKPLLAPLKQCLCLQRQYASVKNADNELSEPLTMGEWYEIWYVVDNATVENGGQVYSVYVKGGEFS